MRLVIDEIHVSPPGAYRKFRIETEGDPLQLLVAALKASKIEYDDITVSETSPGIHYAEVKITEPSHA